MTKCPSSKELQQVLGDLPSDAQSEEVAKHLDECSGCQAKLEEIATGGTNLSQLVERAHESEPVAESAYWPAIRAASQQAAYAATIVPVPRSRLKDSSTNFLLPPTDPAYLGRLAHFDVMLVIGRGGMGIVLEAFDTRLQRNVALKVLDPELAHDETSRQRSRACHRAPHRRGARRQHRRDG